MPDTTTHFGSFTQDRRWSTTGAPTCLWWGGGSRWETLNFKKVPKGELLIGNFIKIGKINRKALAHEGINRVHAPL